MMSESYELIKNKKDEFLRVKAFYIKNLPKLLKKRLRAIYFIGWPLFETTWQELLTNPPSNENFKMRLGSVIIVNSLNDSVGNAIDTFYDTLQDELGWELGVRLVNQPSRAYYMLPHEITKIDPYNERYFLPSDQKMFFSPEKCMLIWGTDIRPPTPVSTEENFPVEHQKLSITREKLEHLQKIHTQYAYLLNPDLCWSRPPTFIGFSKVQKISQNMIKKFIETEKNPQLPFIWIYGRYWGSGKTLNLINLMRFCSKRSIPFLYRTEFWRNVHSEQDYQKLNSENAVFEWIHEKTAQYSITQKCIVFLDECDPPFSKLTTLKEQFFIIEGAKELPPKEHRYNFTIFDISKDFQLTPDEIAEILRWHINNANLQAFFPEKVVKIIANTVKVHGIWEQRRTAAIALRALTYSFADAVTKNSQRPYVNQITALKWATLADSYWLEKWPKIHDVHPEYLIFDGNTIVDMDKEYVGNFI